MIHSCFPFRRNRNITTFPPSGSGILLIVRGTVSHRILPSKQPSKNPLKDKEREKKRKKRSFGKSALTASQGSQSLARSLFLYKSGINILFPREFHQGDKEKKPIDNQSIAKKGTTGEKGLSLIPSKSSISEENRCEVFNNNKSYY